MRSTLMMGRSYSRKIRVIGRSRAGGRGAELLAIGGGRILVLEEAMQERGVRRIDADFERLKPVAFHQPLEREGIGVRRDEAVDLGEGRRLALAKIGPEDSAALHDRIGALPDVLAERRVRRLGGRFEALSLDVEQPAVERAAQAAVLEPPEGEVRAAMRTIAVHQAEPPRLVAEENEILSEQTDGFDRAAARRARRERDGLPVVAHQLAAGRIRPDPGDQVVLLLIYHGAVPRVALARRSSTERLSDCCTGPFRRQAPQARFQASEGALRVAWSERNPGLYVRLSNA